MSCGGNDRAAADQHAGHIDKETKY